MRHLARCFSCLLLFAIAAPATAASPLFYLGLSAGEGINGGDLRARTSVNLPYSGADRSYKAFAGLELGRNFALEVAYHDFGNRRLAGILDFGFDLDLSGYSGTVLWVLPLRRFDLFAKGGWLRWEEDGTTVSLIGARNHSETGSNLLLGGGLRFHLGERIGLRAEWERFDFDAGTEDALSAGVELRF
jgi:hypothetical protein